MSVSFLHHANIGFKPMWLLREVTVADVDVVELFNYPEGSLLNTKVGMRDFHYLSKWHKKYLFISEAEY